MAPSECVVSCELHSMCDARSNSGGTKSSADTWCDAFIISGSKECAACRGRKEGMRCGVRCGAESKAGHAMGGEVRAGRQEAVGDGGASSVRGGLERRLRRLCRETERAGHARNKHAA